MSNIADFAFTGREWDFDTGSYYYRARHLDPVHGRFTTRDPIPNSLCRGGDLLNQYTYVLNRPTAYVDPTGTLWVEGGTVARMDAPQYLGAKSEKIVVEPGYAHKGREWEDLDAKNQAEGTLAPGTRTKGGNFPHHDDDFETEGKYKWVCWCIWRVTIQCKGAKWSYGNYSGSIDYVIELTHWVRYEFDDETDCEDFCEDQEEPFNYTAGKTPCGPGNLDALKQGQTWWDMKTRYPREGHPEDKPNPFAG